MKLHGADVLRFLRQQGVYEHLYDTPRFRSRLKWWSQGGCASYPVVDAMLVAVNMHLSQLPDEAWVVGPQAAPQLELELEELMVA